MRLPTPRTSHRLTERPLWRSGSAVKDGRMYLLGGGTYETPAVPERIFKNEQNTLKQVVQRSEKKHHIFNF